MLMYVRVLVNTSLRDDDVPVHAERGFAKLMYVQG
jgi:prolyl oligopeptidase PreP (S9A serine peptidase family)